MKAVIRIATRLSAFAPIPAEFLPIAGLEHLGLIYQQKILTTPEEFNATLATVTDRRFQSRGCQFIPYMLTAEDERLLEGRPSPAPAPTPEPEAVEEDPASEPVAEESPDAATEDPAPTTEEPPAETPPAFELVEGSRIMLGDERVAGLFGEEKHLRVAAKHAELRPQIEAWLQTINPTDQ